jgi:Flp pilus assembly protein TadB
MNENQNLTQPQIAYALLTVRQFCAKHTAFPVQGIYTLIFNETKNGLKESGAILRIGRKVLVDESRFFAWVRKINGITD